VLNGTTIAGLARETSFKLAQAGFHTVQLPATAHADTPTATYTGNFVYYDYGPAERAGGSGAAEGRNGA